MTKPIELSETQWTMADGRIWDGDPKDYVCIASFCAHTTKDGVERKMMLAAKDMVRVLLRRLQHDTAPCLCHLTDPERCLNCEDRDLLQKAGVLP